MAGLTTCSLINSVVFLLVFLISILNKSNQTIQQPVHRRFEYKYSFKPPYLAQKDGSVPFWEYGGNAIASSESVRVAPSLKSQKGAIWTKSQTTFDWWEIEIVFRVSGRGRIGADGLAVWYTSEKGDYNGDVFGSSDRWVGLGVFFDSFDNDNKHNNPYIMAVLNNGQQDFDHQNDGTTQLLSGCLRDFRNKPFPTRARIEYYQNTLTVLFHNGMNNNNNEYDMCLRAENVVLPKYGYFGVSAATGGLADDHDVFHFLTTSLHLPGQITGDPNAINEMDQAKLTQEYQDYQKKLEQQKEEYRREHPDDNKKDDMEDWFETDNQRELRQIWQSQSQMADALRELSRKMDEVIGRQERTMGLLSAQASGGGPPQIQQQGGGGTAQQQPNYADTIRRFEVDTLMNNQNLLLTTIREIRTIIGDLYTRSDTIIQNQQRQPTAQIQSTGYDVQSMITEMRDGLNQVKQGIAAVGSKVSDPSGLKGGCPNPQCLGVYTFLIFIGVQLCIMLLYSMYKESREAQAKKFY